MTEEEPMMIRADTVDMQVCVPSWWKDERVLEYAENSYHHGGAGWTIRKDKKSLNGDPERAHCSARGGFVHITLDA